MAVYEVTTEDGITIVEAKYKNAAINHVVRKGVTARSIKPSELLQYIRDGHRVEVVGEEAEDVVENSLEDEAA